MNCSGHLVNLVFYLAMNAYHLRKPEVIYELKIRNVDTGDNANELRKRLTQCFSADTQIDETIVNSLDADVELEECEAKYHDLSSLVSDYEGNYKDNEFHRILARLWHLCLRVERIPVGASSDNEQSESKDRLLSKSRELLDSFKETPAQKSQVEIRTPTDEFLHRQPTKTKAQETNYEFPKTFEIPLKPPLTTEDDENLVKERKLLEEWRQKEERKLQQERRHQEEWLQKEERRLQEERRKQEERWQQEERRLHEARTRQEEKWKLEEVHLRQPPKKIEARNPQEDWNCQEIRRSSEDYNLYRFSPTQEDTSATSRPRYVPVYKWGLKFDNSGSSIASFLERVEELRRARGVTHQELYEFAVDLFAGSALVWYRAASIRIQSWHQLTKELREVFQPADYDIRLHQEIFNRLQGDNEPIDLYIAAMEGLYGRLAVPVPEPTCLAQIYNNLHPQLQDRLALCSIHTLEQLRSMGRRAEAGRLSAVRVRPTTTGGTTLEPDLAYQDQSHRRKLLSGRVAGVQPSDSDRQDPVCWNCEGKGHRFRFCRQPKRRFCFGCGKEDVFKRDCIRCNPKNGQGKESERK